MERSILLDNYFYFLKLFKPTIYKRETKLWNKHLVKHTSDPTINQ